MSVQIRKRPVRDKGVINAVRNNDETGFMEEWRVCQFGLGPGFWFQGLEFTFWKDGNVSP